MTPEESISSLDQQIAAHGQTVTIRRTVPNSAPIEATVRAFVRGYKPEEITDGITLGHSQVVLSPTDLKDTPFWGDENLPRVTDAVLISGRKRNVSAPSPVKMNDVLVRINLAVAG